MNQPNYRQNHFLFHLIFCVFIVGTVCLTTCFEVYGYALIVVSHFMCSLIIAIDSFMLAKDSCTSYILDNIDSSASSTYAYLSIIIHTKVFYELTSVSTVKSPDIRCLILTSMLHHLHGSMSVSYTHLDVYKRQRQTV